MTRFPHFLPAAIFCGAIFLCGCGGRAVSPYDGLSPRQSRELAAKLALQRDAELQADLQSAFLHHPPQNILILSGGDADGAFGCGVLAGWRDAPHEPRPVFDIVTGVSTGALMATFAFLGEKQDDADLRDVYTHIRDKDIMDGPFTPGPPNSIFDTGPLQRLIAQRVTPQAIRRVAAAHRQGRRLYVATVELDSGALYIWPLSKIAADAVAGDEVRPDGIERFRKILLAAASIPMVFPPVEIDGGLHVDAGLRETVFVRQAMLGLSRASASSASAGQDGSPPTVYAIFNGKLRSSPQPTSDDVLHIGVRSLEIYTEALQVFNLRDAAHLAAAHDPPFRFRWIAEADGSDSATIPSIFEPMFDPARTAQLYETGRALASRPDGFWNEGAPRLDDDPR